MIPIYLTIESVDGVVNIKSEDLKNPKHVQFTITNHLPFKMVSPKSGIYLKRKSDLSYAMPELEVKCLHSDKYEIFTQVKTMGIFKTKDELKDFIMENFILTNFKYDNELKGFPKFENLTSMGFAVGKDCKMYGMSVQDGKVTCNLTADQICKAIVYDKNDVIIIDVDTGKTDRKNIKYERLDPKIEEDIKGLSKYVSVLVYDEDIPALSMEINPNVEHVIPTWEGQNLKFVACAKYCNLILPIDVTFQNSFGFLKKLVIKLKKLIEPNQKIGAVTMGEKSKLVSLDENEMFTLKDQSDNVYKISCNGNLQDLPKGIYNIMDNEVDQYINGFVISKCSDVFLLFDEETWLQKIKEEEEYAGGNTYELDKYVMENMVRLNSETVKNTGEIMFNQSNGRVLVDGLTCDDKKLSWMSWDLRKGEPLTDTLLRELLRIKNLNNHTTLAVDVKSDFDINCIFHNLSSVCDELAFKVNKMEQVHSIMQCANVLPNFVSFITEDMNLLKEINRKYPNLIHRVESKRMKNMSFVKDFLKKIITIDGDNDKHSGFGGNATINNQNTSGIAHMVHISQPNTSTMDKPKQIISVFNKLKRKVEEVNTKFENDHVCNKKKCLPKKLV